MKVSFINPRPNELHTTMLNSSPPLGILYIASMLRNAGIEVSALDQGSGAYSMKQVVDWIMKENPDILGFSTLLSSSFTAPKIAKEIKKKNPNIVILFGNHHATFNAERILLKYPYVDIVVRGEGEQTCFELVNCLSEKKCLKEVLGITFRLNNQIISNPDRPLLNDIDSLPFPERDLLQDEYHNTTIGIKVAPKKFTSVLSSRGCPFKCRFCSCTNFTHNLWRSRSIPNILEELHFLVSQGYKQIMFVDDNFTLNQKRVIELCHRMRKEKIDLEWICEGRVNQSSYIMFQEMVKAGCRMMYFGIESASQKVLDYYNKGINPKQTERAVANARKAGVDVIVGSLIIGAPNETKDDIDKTLRFTQRLKIDIPQINILEVFPGNAIWEEFINKGLLNEEKYWETGVCIPEIYPNAVPLNELWQILHNYYKSYLRRPQYILKQILLTMRSLYRLNVVFNNISRTKTIVDSINNLASMPDPTILYAMDRIQN
jgi:radical SAM superfamily enzyme YgiQ (UPF0313 family)